MSRATSKPISRRDALKSVPAIASAAVVLGMSAIASATSAEDPIIALIEGHRLPCD